MPVDVDVSVNMADVQRGIEKALRAGINLAPVWRELGDFLREDQELHQEKQEAPPGASWPPLAESTRKRRRGRKIFSKRFAKAATLRFDRQNLELIHRAEWASAHQDGASTGKGLKSKLPARPFFYLSREFQEIAARKILDHIERAWKR